MTEEARIVRPTDTDEVRKIAAHFTTPDMVKWWWEDSIAEKPLEAFTLLFLNPANVVIGLPEGDDYAGVFVFNKIELGWRAQVHAALWSPAVARKRELHRRVLSAAMLLGGLHVIDVTLASHNRASRMAVKRAGFVKRGTFPKALSYQGVRIDAEWWEITRAILGLPAVEPTKE
jgi:RimJ/RimL family protein N-acetyltransferase